MQILFIKLFTLIGQFSLSNCCLFAQYEPEISDKLKKAN